jgi:hypothetical protein
MVAITTLVPIFAGFFFMRVYGRSKILYALLLTALIANNAYDIYCGVSQRKMPDYATLSKWLKARQFLYGYSDYYTAYSVNFDSKEEITLSPTLYRKDFDDRWPDLTRKVRNMNETVIIVYNGEWPQSAVHVESALGKCNVKYTKSVAGDFVIFSGFSRKILPENLDLSWARH